MKTPQRRNRSRFAASSVALCSTLLVALPLTAESPPADAPATQILLVRHAEAEGTGGDAALTAAGRRRAEALAELLAGEDLDAVLATDTRRARDTAAPVAARHGLEVALYDHRDLAELAARLRQRGGTVLVVGHSNTTPELVRLLGGEPGEPIAHDEHDRLYRVDAASGRTLLERFAGGPAAPPQWGGLEEGPYAVGFNVVRTDDGTRGYRPLVDYRGRPATGPTTRPMQVALWYPAAPGAGANAMPWGAYLELAAGALGEAGDAAALLAAAEEEARRELLGRFFPDGLDDATWAEILATPTAARRDAAWAPGRFPVVLHLGPPPHVSSILAEYLASHGYVVAGLPILGSGPAWYNRGTDSLEWWLSTGRDAGFLHGLLRELPGADAERAAAVGMMASAGLLYQMESMQLRALAGLESSFPAVLGEAPWFEARRARIPILDLRNGTAPAPDPLLAELRFADLLTVRLPRVSHVELYPIRRLARPAEAAEDRGFETLARVARRFLDAHLAGDEDAARELAGLAADGAAGGPVGARLGEVPLEVQRRPAAEPVPTEEEIHLLVRRGQSEELRRVWRDARNRGFADRFADPTRLRTAALFRLFDDHDASGAAAALEIVVEIAPTDVEAWSLLGRAHAVGGDPVAARQAYDRARALLDAPTEMPPAARQRLEERLSRWSDELP